MIKSKPATKEYRDNFDHVFSGKKEKPECNHDVCAWDVSRRVAVCVDCGKTAASMDGLLNE